MPGNVYNLCTGVGHSMHEALELALMACHTPVPWAIRPEILRTVDDPVYVGDNTKLTELGWRPTIPLQQTLEDSINYWRRHLDEPY
jgi:GDP-4-dehydro-6-deoxy-D-mannose reductase